MTLYCRVPRGCIIISPFFWNFIEKTYYHLWQSDIKMSKILQFDSRLFVVWDRSIRKPRLSLQSCFQLRRSTDRSKWNEIAIATKSRVILPRISNLMKLSWRFAHVTVFIGWYVWIICAIGIYDFQYKPGRGNMVDWWRRTQHLFNTFRYIILLI